VAAEATNLSALGAEPGQHLVVDWTKVAVGLHIFRTLLAWSRYRFVRFAWDEAKETTLALIQWPSQSPQF
jgi:hypothetical protein